MRLRAGLIGSLLVVVAGLAGCSSSGSSGGSPSASTGAARAQIAAAHLRRCPPSSATAVTGGLPDLTLSCLGDGPAVHLAGLTGKPTVVNVWGSWCIPCQREAGYLSSVYDADHAKVRFLGVDTADTDGSALNFGLHVTPPVRYPSVVDAGGKFLDRLAVAPGPPETAFVDRNGKLVHVRPGQYTSAAELKSDIATYLHVGS